MSFLIEQLLLPKSPAAPFFHLSLEGSKFDECWQPFLGGLFRAPMPVCYKTSFESAELILVISGNSAINGAPNLPVAVNNALAELLEQNRIEAYDFFWLVTDATNLVDQSGMDLNLSHHAWYFPDEIFPEVMGGRRVEVALDAGIFSYAGSKVSLSCVLGIVDFEYRLPGELVD